MKKRENKKVLEIIKKESRINDLQKVIKHILISLFLIGLFLFILLIALSLIEITGFSTYIASKGGYITQVSISSSKTVDVWGGIYGLVLRVPNFTQQLNEELDSGGIERADIFFDCVKYDAEWGPEFYASTNASLDLSTSDVSSGTTEMIDEFINCSNEVFCANNTFTKNMTIFLGGTNITNIPSTFTYKFNGDNNIFDVGVLNVSGSLVFVSHINESIQQGFNPDFLVNYQMLLPTPANTTQTYYFYVDPDDECPSGGIGNGINANIYGYVFDSGSNPIENVTVNVAGYNGTTNSSGFYNFSTYVIEGNYNLIAQKSGYDPYLKIIGINFSNYILNRNITMETETPLLSGGTVNINVFGVVSDSAGSSLSDVNIYLGGSNATTNSTGHYSFNTTAITGINPIIAIKQNYNNYYALLNITNTSSLNHNITLESANLNDYPTGPYTENKIDDEEGDQKNKAKIESERRGEDFWISASEINKQVRENTFVEEKISIYNFGDSNMQVLFTISSNLEEIIKLDSNLLTISPDSSGDVTLTISGIKPVGVYKGTLTLSGDLESEIPVKIEIVSKKFSIENLLMKISLFKEEVKEGDSLKYELGLQNLLSEQGYKINLKHMILNSDESKIYLEEEESVEIKNSLGLLKEFNLPKNITKGKYLVRVEAAYLNYFSSINSPFTIIKPMYMYSFFGIPLWIIFVGISAFSFILLNGLLYRWQVQKRKRYHLALKIDTLPKQGNRSIKLGKIAEKKIPAYYNLDDLTTHAIVAGATGGGKSISAQVIIEEALGRGIAVVVFDPTAQWSGMLRKCEDKKMLSLYPKFGLKESDAKAFAGNVRQITNPKQAIDIKKYINPGQIQIFTLNKLDPSGIDLFVAGVINSVFKSDPQEHPELKTLLVFDEVHRLLPKFGGSGRGFLQIERACREFRKWGLGVMLVSQVLSDFVGEIKANINTEIQMRVAEENDLERIKERYGLDALKSLVRADVGTGMIQNAEYNKGLPYFINFRPTLHNTRRLSDEVLEKYNKYNDIIEDIEYQIEQLEGEKEDVFDLKIELKLVKDKLMLGNFTVVDIYLEGLKPRIEKQWEKIGKKAKEREINLIDEGELRSSLADAKRGREKWEEENKEKEEEKAEGEKEEDIGSKILSPLTFENGMMISSIKELAEVLPELDESVFNSHVNDKKNDIAAWVSREIDPNFGEEIKKAKDKQSIINEITGYLNINKTNKKDVERVINKKGV